VERLVVRHRSADGYDRPVEGRRVVPRTRAPAILASAFSAIVVYAQELVPGNVGMIAGLFFGFAFGVAGLGAAVLGQLADMTSVTTVFKLCAWLPPLGLLTALLPETEPRRLGSG
jgi:MFS transporter, FSR family, fosmidomycin resistance protein